MAVSVEPEAERAPRPRTARWADPADRTLVLGALGLWLGSRFALLMAAACGHFTTRIHNLGNKGSFLHTFDVWDAHWYLDIAQHGYFYGPDKTDQFGQSTDAFLPGTPALIHVVHWFVPSYPASGLIVSAVAGAFAAVALARMAHQELLLAGVPGADKLALRAPLYLCVAPYGVFLLAPYAEPLFLALALPAWMCGRQGRWREAGILCALATIVKVNGLFLLAGLAVGWITWRRQDGRKLVDPQLAWLAAPLVTFGAYCTYLHAKTGRWNEWQDAQVRAWGRALQSPIHSWRITWSEAFNPAELTDYAWARRGELLCAVIGLVVVVLLARARRWPEMTYLATTLLALTTCGIYLAIPRSTLLWWPAWMMLTVWIAKRPTWVHQAWLWFSAPICGVLTVAFCNGFWVN